MAAEGVDLYGAKLLQYLFGEVPQGGDPNEPTPVRLNRTEWSLGMEVDGMSEVVKTDGGKTTHDQISYGPVIGLRRRGAIYHPNLISFDLNGEAGWSWLDDKLTGPGSNNSRHENGDLWRYLAQVNFLPGKPYNGIFSASRNETYRNYDAFSTYRVKIERYGGRANWKTGSLDLNIDSAYRDEHSSGINGTTDLSETYVNFSGTQTRNSGQTTLTYRYDEFDNVVNGGDSLTSVSHSVGASDSETFGSRRQGTAVTGASYSRYEYFTDATDTVTANENVTFQHTPDLESYLNLNFSDSSMGSVSATQFQGESGVRHQLYESLTSTLELHGSYDDSSSSTGSTSNDRYGVGLHENYTKRVAPWGRLTIGGAIIVDHEDHDSVGGILTTLNEPHRIFLNNVTYLNNPRVLTATVQVRSASGIPATVNVDYRLVTSGQLTGIQLLIGSTSLHDGDSVLVDYQSDSLYTATFESFNGSAQIRLDLYNKFGIYGRINWLDNTAPAEAQTQTLTDLVGGADFTWRGFRLSAEYEDYDSNFSKYQAWRFYQSYMWQSSDTSTLNLDFNQIFYDYPDTGTQEQYQFVARYNAQLLFSLAWYAQGGYSFQHVAGTDQDNGLASTGLTWSRGKLSLRTGYMYNYQLTTSSSNEERREQNYFFAYLKRTF